MYKRQVKDFIKIGGISGLESLVRNFFYMIMIIRMVNAVSEQGTYWMANNFIWGWLLLPVIQLGELIKRDCEMCIRDRINIIANMILRIILLSFIAYNLRYNFEFTPRKYFLSFLNHRCIKLQDL